MTPAPFAPLAVEATDLACSRAGRLVFTDVSFRVVGGQVLAVTGPNGSGKSSLLRVLAGLLAPAEGAFRIEGAGEDQAVTHYVGHADALKAAMTLRETLRFWSAVYMQRGRVALDANFHEAAEAVGLRHALEFPVGVLSAGQRLTKHLSAGGLVVAATHQDLPVPAVAAIDLGDCA
jgi:heme exporter protein A